MRERTDIDRRMLVFLCTCFLFLCCGCKREAQPEPAADLVVLGGKIVTMDERHPEVEAVAARRGIIVALGSRRDIQPYIGEETRVMELDGGIAVPGFIEGHGHFLRLGEMRSQLNLRAATSWQDILDQVAAATIGLAPGALILGRGWHQDKWTAAPQPAVEGFPIHDSLSAVSPRNPVVLTHASGHAVFVNAAAMRLAGIDASTQDPPGGEILRDSHGKPTGLLRETAQSLIEEVRSSQTRGPEETRRLATLAAQECLSKGVTTFQDAGSSFETLEQLRRLAAGGGLGIRLWLMVGDSNQELAAKLAAAKTIATPGKPFFAVGGIKLVMDGALGSRGAWLLDPYQDKPDFRGLTQLSRETAREAAELAIQHEMQLCIHAIGDRANREVLDLYQQVFASHPERQGLRWRVEHAQHLHPDDVPRFAALGVLASIQAVHCTSDGSWVPARLGDSRSQEGAYVWQKLLHSGAILVNGTDTPVEDVDPIGNFYAAVTRRLPDGTSFYPAQCMTRLQALRSMTLDAAYGAFEEGLKGSLEPGKLADITVLSRDIMSIPAEEIPETRVIATIVGGTVRYPLP